MGEAGPPSCGDGPEFAFRIMHQDASHPMQKRGDDMTSALPAACSARHQGWTQVSGRQHTSAKHANDGPGLRQQASRARLAQSAPTAPPANRGRFAADGAEAKAAHGAQQNEHAASIEGGSRFIAKSLSPGQDGPRRIESEIRPCPPGRSEKRRPTVGPGEALSGRCQPHQGSCGQSGEARPHGVPSGAASGERIAAASSTNRGAASMRRL
ncbi:hypothetical protein D3C73_781640 [compost metagenome]